MYESLTTGRLIISSLHVNLEKLVGVNYTSLIGMKRVSKIEGFGTEDADALAQQNANERFSFAICGSLFRDVSQGRIFREHMKTFSCEIQTSNL